jgi:hypothetical protein
MKSWIVVDHEMVNLGLGYNKEETNYEASTSKKHDVSPSFQKGGSKTTSQ